MSGAESSADLDSYEELVDVSCRANAILQGNIQSPWVLVVPIGVEAQDLDSRFPALDSLPDIVDGEASRGVVIRIEDQAIKLTTIFGSHDAFAGPGRYEQQKGLTD
jgi:hypothetical protein